MVTARRLAPLGQGQWEELYRLMVSRRFPAVPPSLAEAKPHFAQARLYGLMEKSQLEVAFVFGPPQEGISFLDVVCTPKAQGLWATPRVLRELYHLAFDTLKLRVVWVQAHHKKALKAALQAGFLPSTPLDGPAPVLVMTPFGMPPRYRKPKLKGDNRHGQSVPDQGADAAPAAAAK
jgi:hypothetical protein